ncbi:MAG: DNA cytosine methyltransferase [Desulfovibrio sp.]|nr:DNA cytosine methyltransferase [Desulfovibrio sp.]
MRYLSLCSGIEAASVAWRPLGWEAVAFSEIEAFPSAVLAHHYPDVPNLGDMTRVQDWSKYRGAVDLVVAGTPCQDFSVAGKRAGMAGERSGLALVFAQVLSVVRPRWLVWENVPGVFSTNGGRDFGTFLRALDDCGYSCAWRVLDAQFFGVPQRRRRIFVVGHLGDWRPAAAVLFERDSVCGNPPARGKAAKDIAGTLEAGIGRSRGAGTPISSLVQSHWNGCPHPSLVAREHGGGIGMSDQELFAQGGAGLVADNLAYVPPIVGQAMSCKWSKGTSGPAGDEHHNLIAFHGSQDPCASGSVTHPLGRNAGLECCVASHQKLMVRRLTPRECERLQGFPDDYTDVPFRGKPAADGPRYRALGNSMAVPVMRWIGERISRQGSSHEH